MKSYIQYVAVHAMYLIYTTQHFHADDKYHTIFDIHWYVYLFYISAWRLQTVLKNSNYVWSTRVCVFSHSFPLPVYLLHTCLKTLPKGVLHSFSACLSHLPMLNFLQMSGDLTKPPFSFFSVGLVVNRAARFPRQFDHTCASSSVVRKAAPFSQFNAFLPKM